MILPPGTMKAILELVELVGEKLAVAMLESLVKNTREAQLKRNKSLFQRLISWRGKR